MTIGATSVSAPSAAAAAGPVVPMSGRNSAAIEIDDGRSWSLELLVASVDRQVQAQYPSAYLVEIQTEAARPTWTPLAIRKWTFVYNSVSTDGRRVIFAGVTLPSLKATLTVVEDGLYVGSTALVSPFHMSLSEADLLLKRAGVSRQYQDVTIVNRTRGVTIRTPYGSSDHSRTVVFSPSTAGPEMCSRSAS